MNYSTGELAAFTDSVIIGNPDLRVTSIAFDSRNIFSAAGTAFLAINTSKNSGEKFIQSALDKGVSIVISESQTIDNASITWIIVNDSLKFLHRLAKHHMSRFQLTTIGITGSNGKTVVKEWLYQSLNSDYNTVKSPKSFNSRLGVPLSLLKTTADHEIGIFEIGISKPGEMEIMADMFSPEIGILTHIGTAHESNFDSQDEIIEEKIKLFSNADTIIFNGDNPLVISKITSLYSGKNLISYGLRDSNNVTLKINQDQKEITIKYFDEEFLMPAQQRDDATLNNALCVISVLKVLGFSTVDIIKKINALKPVEMRLESVNGLRNNLVINDYYNLDLDSLKIAFQFINEYKKPSKTLVLTDFIESKNIESLYRHVAELSNQQNFEQVILIGDDIVQFKKYFDAKVSTFSSSSQLIDSHYLNTINDNLILLKGARKFEIEKINDHLELQKHDTVLEVNLNAILHNINVHRTYLAPQTKMMAMVKAYSYGLGGYEIAEFLQHHHIDYLGVAYADEGVELRKNGISTPIMVMNPEQHSYEIIIDYDLEPEIYSFRVLDLFYSNLVQKGLEENYPIHLKIETGMNRLGFTDNEVDELAIRLAKMKVKVASVFSHLSSADDPDEELYTQGQIEMFDKIFQRLAKALGYMPLRHILNSSGITKYPEHQFDMVRIGIGMVGVSPDPNIKKQLRNAVTFKTVISQISPVFAGSSVGYNRRYMPKEDTRIATIPVGYADGVPRLIGNGIGKVGIRGKLYPIVGNICMDMLMVDIGDAHVKEGESVIIFNSNPSLEMFAKYCQTIPYEVLTSVSRRVKRIYIKD